MAKRVFFTVLLIFGGSLLLVMMCNLITSAFSAPLLAEEGIEIAFIASLWYLILLFIFTREKFIWQFLLIAMLILLLILFLAFATTNNISFNFSYFILGFIIGSVIPNIAQFQANKYKKRKLAETISK